MEERIVKAAGADHFDAPSVEELTGMITRAGKIPRLVNSLYQQGEDGENSENGENKKTVSLNSPISPGSPAVQAQSS